MTYLDTSAMIRAWKLDVAPAHVTRSHSVAEFYATLTRGLTVTLKGVKTRVQFAPKEAAAGAKETFSAMRFKDLDGPQSISELEAAAVKNVHGANIHDWMHAAAAKKAGCNQIVTTNEKHFKLVTALPLVEPTHFFS